MKNKIVRDEPCPSCRARGGDKTGNHLIVFEDGNKFCNRCGYKEINSEEEKEMGTIDLKFNDIMQLQSADIASRGLSEDVLKLYSVKVSFDGNGQEEAVFFPMQKNGQITGFKRRFLTEKDFKAIGDGTGCQLFGMLSNPKNGKFLVITEGEIDALTVKQAFLEDGKNYRVCSLTYGASTRSFKESLEYIESFEKVVLCFDQDEAGRKAVEECASLVSIGKVAVARWDESLGKDANELYLSGHADKLLYAISNAEVKKPDGIRTSSDIKEFIRNREVVRSVASYPFEELNKMLKRIRLGELIVLAAGSGVGKSQVLREIAYSLFKNTTHNIGMMFMEEGVDKTAISLGSLSVNIPIHIDIDSEDDYIRKRAEQNMDKALANVLDQNRFFFYDHFGSNEIDNILQKIRYFAKAFDCKFIFLDHLSIIVSGNADIDERKNIDILMTKLRTLIQELNITIFAVSHLKRKDGAKAHEVGGEVSMNELRGSGAIGQLSDAVIGVERNLQAEDIIERNTLTLRVIKNRHAGETGKCDRLLYNQKTGRIVDSVLTKVEKTDNVVENKVIKKDSTGNLVETILTKREVAPWEDE